MTGFPSPRMRAFLVVYDLAWWLLMPLVLAYLWRRGRRDALYRRHLRERFGRVPDPIPGAVWVHAVSLGEFRSAVPLIRALLDRGEAVQITCTTPAGRREAEAVLAADIAADRARVSWAPVDTALAVARFLRRARPRYGLVMEIEVWPRLIATCRRRGVPLLMCNAQYPSRSFERDRKRLKLRAELMTGFAGALVKSELQRDRFAAVGVTNIAVTGELRFDQPVPVDLRRAGRAARHWLAGDRPAYAFVSVVEGEDALVIGTIKALIAAHGDGPAPFFVYVPRAPERFDAVAGLLEAAGLAHARRSAVLDADVAPIGDAPGVSVLLGDSMGEMYAYLEMADRIVVGGGFNPNGAHNISEALSVGKPVWTGPHVWTIEYPATEAAQAGVLRQTAATAEALAASIGPDATPPAGAAAIEAFFAAHSGATARTLAAIPGLLAQLG
ncbi:MAG: 3-deoxy-D-manno-octulosonic-acid transferase [Rhodobacteraceae bacterium HLUCCA08]|nr:MAG: 3-deoxy-D-manno-octulosonic-acid transferase [Rhodobacteraceae bacterium HLUCCA08]